MDMRSGEKVSLKQKKSGRKGHTSHKDTAPCRGEVLGAGERRVGGTTCVTRPMCLDPSGSECRVSVVFHAQQLGLGSLGRFWRV